MFSIGDIVQVKKHKGMNKIFEEEDMRIVHISGDKIYLRVHNVGELGEHTMNCDVKHVVMKPKGNSVNMS